MDTSVLRVRIAVAAAILAVATLLGPDMGALR